MHPFAKVGRVGTMWVVSVAHSMSSFAWVDNDILSEQNSLKEVGGNAFMMFSRKIFQSVSAFSVGGSYFDEAG